MAPGSQSEKWGSCSRSFCLPFSLCNSHRIRSRLLRTTNATSPVSCACWVATVIGRIPIGGRRRNVHVSSCSLPWQGPTDSLRCCISAPFGRAAHTTVHVRRLAPAPQQMLPLLCERMMDHRMLPRSSSKPLPRARESGSPADPTIRSARSICHFSG